MHLFDYEIERNRNANTVELQIEQEDNNTHIQRFYLVFPESIKEANNLQTFIAVQMIHWINTTKEEKLKVVVKQFNQFCKVAEKLKI